MARWLLALTLFLFSQSALAHKDPPIPDPQWLALLHYEGGKSSASPGPPFFLSLTGHLDPEAELAATMELMKSDPEGPCRFPARAIYLRSWREQENLPQPNCERWEKWREAISAKGIELVFATAFINSPSSMYGHTLLKFSRAGKTQGHELLDYTLSYGAQTGEAEGLPYLWKGLAGGFDGYFVTAPFYLKVKEYNYVENRDFWIYSLNLTAAELELLVAHAWELKDVSFAYYFLHKNCSYYLLQYLEVARPGQGLTNAFPLWAVPLDTIRRLRDLNWIASSHFRPSRHRVLRDWKSFLTDGEAGFVPEYIEKGEYPKLSPEREAHFLDASYEYLRYSTEGKILSPQMAAREKEIFEKRRRFQSPVHVFDYSAELAPESGHHTSRAGIVSGKNISEPFAELSFRFALHDLLADPHGYEKNSELSMGDFRFRFEEKRFFLESLDLLKLRSLAPSDSWGGRTSWNVRLGADRAREFLCKGWKCVYEELSGGMGASFELGPLLIFGLAKMDLNYGGVFSRHFRISGGPSLGFASPLWKNARWLAEYDHRFRIMGEKKQKQRLQLGISQSFSDLELRVFGQKNRSELEWGFGFFQYF